MALEAGVLMSARLVTTEPSERAERVVPVAGAKLLDPSKVPADDTAAAFFSAIPSIYEFEYVSNPESEDLVIVLSASDRIHKLINATRKNVLYMTDKSWAYYFRNIYQVVAALNHFISAGRFRHVLFMGGSKAGFSAILLGSQCVKAAPDRAIYCLAFSPHTRLYPKSERMMRFKSYELFMERVAVHPNSRRLLQRFGDVGYVSNMSNFYVTIAYCERHSIDPLEAAYLSGENIRHYPIPFQFHSSVVPFLIRGQRTARREKLCNVLYEKLTGSDADLQDALPPDAAAFFQIVESADWIPPIHDMVDQSMGWTPAPKS